jgi:dTDP-4-dehydrorhamnose reductase
MPRPTPRSTRPRASPSWPRGQRAAPGVLAREAAARGAWLVHYSTDYVFDGSGSAPWPRRADRPLSVYGRTKLEGEQAIAPAAAAHLILRTSWVYARARRQLRQDHAAAGARARALTVIDDQIGAPTGADLLADVTAHACAPRCAARARPAPTTGRRGETSWHGYARPRDRVRARARASPIKVAPDAIERSRPAPFRRRARASSSPAAPARACIRPRRRSASSCCRCTTSRWSTTR